MVIGFRRVGYNLKSTIGFVKKLYVINTEYSERRSGVERAPERTPIAGANPERYSENFVGARSGAALRYLGQSAERSALRFLPER